MARRPERTQGFPWRTPRRDGRRLRRETGVARRHHRADDDGVDTSETGALAAPGEQSFDGRVVALGPDLDLLRDTVQLRVFYFEDEQSMATFNEMPADDGDD